MAPQLIAGKYEIQEEIASGGMGVLYRAFDPRAGRVVAIKRIHPHLSGDSSFVERFLREARTMARLQHEHIVTLYAVEEEQQTYILVMEFCPGSNLRAMIRKQSHLPVREVVHLARQLALALGYAHSQKIIHRDIKPANVLLDKHGKAKLTDFGIAAALDEARITRPKEVIGTPEYMSPEQARGQDIDSRSDLYSLGIVMHEMLTGKTPYAESSGTSILGRLAYDREELALQFPAHVPSLVQGVVRDLLRRDPADRIPDAETLANQLHEIMFTLPQISSFAAPDELEPTIVSRQSQSPAEEPTRHILQSMVIAPSQESSLNRAASPVEREAPPAKNNAIVQLDRSSSERKRQDPISPPPPKPVGSPRDRPLGLIIAIGTLVGGLTLIGLISFFGSQAERSSPESTAPGAGASLEPSPDSTSKKIEEELKPREENLAKLSILLSDTVNRLQAGRQTSDCSDLKALATETYGKYEDTARDVNRLRRELEREQAGLVSRPAILDMECESRKPLPPRTSVTAPTPSVVNANPNPEPTQVVPVPRPDVPVTRDGLPPVPPSQIATIFSDAALRSLLDQFTRAYERRDVDTLGSISRMDAARRRNVEEMFRTYKTLKLSLASVTREENGAAVVLLIDTAITTAGETVDLSPIAKKITLHVSRQGDTWDKIVW
ncbi:MAG: hypothetical protein OJF50_001409 [Nitrospira sp.]|jgi:serine/threonine-protein kinase|nr:hypothetical protein [Nitrospira sp.]